MSTEAPISAGRVVPPTPYWQSAYTTSLTPLLNQPGPALLLTTYQAGMLAVVRSVQHRSVERLLCGYGKHTGVLPAGNGRVPWRMLRWHGLRLRLR